MRLLKIQHRVYCSREKELTKTEYLELIRTAKNKTGKNFRCCCRPSGTGIRVSELEYITAEAVRRGEAVVQLKGKTRVVFIPDRLRKALLSYLTHEKIVSDRYLLHERKSSGQKQYLENDEGSCLEAGVDEAKVFPHNLRHLFARTYYEADKDMARLADVLGHSSIATTRIYIMTSGQEHRRHMERLDLFTVNIKPHNLCGCPIICQMQI